MTVHLKCTCLLIIYLQVLSDLMNHWQLLNNWFIKNAILLLEMINVSLIKDENTIIKQIIDKLLNREESIYSCIYKLLINVY